jgi:hypothetical protein
VPQKQKIDSKSKVRSENFVDKIKFLEQEKADLFERYCEGKLTKERFVTEKERRSSEIAKLELQIAKCAAIAETQIIENKVTVSVDADIAELLKYVKVIRVFGKGNIVVELKSAL